MFDLQILFPPEIWVHIFKMELRITQNFDFSTLPEPWKTWKLAALKSFEMEERNNLISIVNDFINSFNINLVEDHYRRITGSNWGLLEPGDHVCCGIPGETVLHHGIISKKSPTDYGVEYQVIHYQGETEIDAEVKEEDISTFTGMGSELFLIPYQNDTQEDKQNTLNVAMTFLHSEDKLKGQYYIFGITCDTFATFCRTGKNGVSKQVVKIIDYMTPILAGSIKKSLS